MLGGRKALHARHARAPPMQSKYRVTPSYQFGNAAGIDSIDAWAICWLGKTIRPQLAGEQPGVLPGPDWMRIYYPQERWSQAYTANVSIGQGYDLSTPLQMAMAYQPSLIEAFLIIRGW